MPIARMEKGVAGADQDDVRHAAVRRGTGLRPRVALAATLALACAGSAQASASAAQPGTGGRHAKARHGCPTGHVRLGLRGPHLISARRAEVYSVVAHVCARAPRTIRVSVRGPEKRGWRARHVRSGSTLKRRITLRFAPLTSASSPTFVIVTLEARSPRGKLLGRRRIKLTYREAPPHAQPGTGMIGWGDNFRGQAGAGFRSGPLTHPVKGVLGGVRQVAAGLNAGFALLSDGTVRAWGANGTGQLGDGTRTESPNPVRVLGLSHVTQIAASGNHVIALLENGTVYAWGANYWGTLGNGTRDAVEGAAHPIPQQVPGLAGVVAVAAGGGDDLAVLSNGTVVGWGEDKNGQLGDGSTGTKTVPTPVRNLSGVRSVAIGGIPSLGGHMLALLNDGQVMVAGENNHGQLGLGDTQARRTPVPLPGLANVTSVSASVTHSLALLANGQVVSWGADADGELGYAAPQMCEAVPCAMSPHPAPVANASAVAAGWHFSVAITGGRVLSWGANELGQLGDGSTKNTTVPVEAGGASGIVAIAASERFTLALAAQGAAPDFFVRPGASTLVAEWTSVAGSQPWALTWRVSTRPSPPWGKPVIVPATAHSYAITGLARARYEVKLIRLNTPSFGRRIAFGTPE
jgi:alpha-tubulin suppressor-like RCC1 family protein